MYLEWINFHADYIIFREILQKFSSAKFSPHEISLNCYLRNLICLRNNEDCLKKKMDSRKVDTNDICDFACFFSPNDKTKQSNTCRSFELMATKLN